VTIKNVSLYKTGFMLDCFVPRNDGTTHRHCEEQSNPNNNIFILIFLFTTENALLCKNIHF